ncbi:MAG: putative dipeptidase [Candidatus Dichloromethanomonas elyunquensis]|nr:MAG: putative dipeptidase [Candidatus Dichloromethanomonas elyunquensis]
MNRLKDIIHSLREDLIQAVQDCVRIKSISGDPEGTKKVLEFYLNLGQQMGFNISNADDLGGVIAYGSGKRTFGIIVHLDTVPEGNGWQVPPFEGRIQDGKIYGRGAIDDKGPAVSALYALKVFKDSGMEPDCQFQIIIGIDEESVWNSTPKLLKEIKEPDFSFVPDSKFPIVIAEKGLIWLEIQKNLPAETLSKKNEIIIQKMEGGGESLNIVPDTCYAILKTDFSERSKAGEKLEQFKKETGYDITLDQSSPDLKLVSKGRSAHAFVCNEGKNAVSQLILFLNRLDIKKNQKDFIQTYCQHLAMESYGESLGLALEDDLTGKLTVNPGYIHIDEKSITLKADIRFPAKEHLDSVKRKVEEAFEVFGGKLRIIDSLKSLNFSEDDPNIRKLLQVYKDYTGDTEAKPLGMEGTTFSKAFQNAVAFGPAFPGMAKVEHQPDEYIEVEHLLRCTEIYALALEALSKKDK